LSELNNINDNQSDDSLDNLSMEELLDSIGVIKSIHRGDIVEGVVVSSDSDGLIVNIGQKSEALIPVNEMRTLEQNDLQSPKIGDSVSAIVVRYESSKSPTILSIDKSLGERGWQDLQDYMDKNLSLEASITGFNKGGLVVEVLGIQGFVPVSQLVTVPRDICKSYDIQDDEIEPVELVEIEKKKKQFLGHKITLKPIEVTRQKNRAILSEREAAKIEREKRKSEMIGQLSIGEVKKGTIIGISSFGAFVDLGGADGLVHISELSWNTVKHPEDVVKIGQDVDVYILNVDQENNKIALSIKRLTPEPWETVSQNYNSGDIVQATITKITNFGAFAKIEDTVEGLIHISELTNDQISHPNEVVEEGQVLNVKILRIEADRKRIGLSISKIDDPGIPEEQSSETDDTSENPEKQSSETDDTSENPEEQSSETDDTSENPEKQSSETDDTSEN
jgi:small subunit ribosomal protein S1